MTARSPKGENQSLRASVDCLCRHSDAHSVGQYETGCKPRLSGVSVGSILDDSFVESNCTKISKTYSLRLALSLIRWCVRELTSIRFQSHVIIQEQPMAKKYPGRGGTGVK